NILNGGLNVTREFSLPIPLKLKAGWVVDDQKRHMSSDGVTYTFNPPGVPPGAAGNAGRVGTNWDLPAPDFNRSLYLTDAAGSHVKPQYLSMAKLYNLYLQHPDWFAPDNVGAYQTMALNRFQIKETIHAGYLRADARFFENRMWLVTGVRFE